MADIGAIVLYKVIKDKDLTTWAKLKLAFFNQAYTTIFTAIATFYDRYGNIPSFTELSEYRSRVAEITSSVNSLQNLDVDADEIDINVAVDALIDSYTQDETLKLLTKFVDNVSMMDTQEIKDQLSAVVMKLDEKTHTSEDLINMDNILLFNTQVDNEYVRFPSGISNTLDSVLGGLYRQETVLLGGKRGAGKSIVCANFVEAQYTLGNTSVYFTIEMSGRETFQRLMSILGGVSHVQLKQGTLSEADNLKLVKARAGMFMDADDLVAEYLEHGDLLKFESALVRNKHLKPDNQIIIVDDRELSITSIDLHLQKLKAKFGDKFKLAVVDYLNQIVVPGNQGGMYDWTAQITISKKLKELARKHDICIVSPYQIDDNGGTRFAKGILDSCDVAFLLDTHDKDDSTISFETTKIRGGPPLDFSNGINWTTLKINPAECEKPAKKSKKEKVEKTETRIAVVEDANDIDKPAVDKPWN